MSVTIFTLFLTAVLGIPDSPHWPETWAATWTLHSTEAGRTYYTQGKTVYSEKTGGLVWKVNSAQATAACSQSLPGLKKDTECSQILHEGRRYIYYPALAQCCLCTHHAQLPSLQSFQYLHEEKYYGKSAYTWQSQNITYLESRDSEPRHRQWIALISPTHVYTSITNWTRTVSPYEFSLPAACIQASDCQSPSCSSTLALTDLFSLYTLGLSSIASTPPYSPLSDTGRNSLEIDSKR